MRVHPRGARGAELFQHIAQLLSEDVERDARLDLSLRSALFRVARAGAAARSNNPRAALALLDGAWLRCRDERDRATLLAEAGGLHAAAVAATTFEAAALDAWPDAGDAAPPAMNTAPHVYERAVAAWPAVTRWRSPRYWIAELGARIVPVEVGVAHRDSDLAQQRLVPFGEYVDSVLLPLARGEAASLGGTVCAVSEVVPVTSARTVAYLGTGTRSSSSARSCRETPRPGRGSCKRPSRAGRAQRSLEPIVSAWVAPRGATTPLHYDRHPDLHPPRRRKKVGVTSSASGLTDPAQRASGRKHVAARRRVHRRRVRPPRGSAAGRRALHSRGLVALCRHPVTSFL